MSGSLLSEESLRSGLLKFSQEFDKNKIEHFVFFGTLLGLCRSGKPIVGDDDVDFYVNHKHYEQVQVLIQSLGFSIDYDSFPNNSDRFMQVHGEISGLEVRVDFYFYDTDSDENFVLDHWNFVAQPKNKAKVLKIPKPLIFPLARTPYEGMSVAVPKFGAIICEFLYGENWRVPQKKFVDYKIDVLGGRPIRVAIKNGAVTLAP